MPLPDKCRCGFDVKHPMIETNEHYNVPGWMLLLMGGTPRPVRVDYRCTRCQTVLATSTDPEVLRNYWQGGKR